MNTILLLVALSCSKPNLLNTSKFPWNEFDGQTLERAKKRCGEIYPKSPCLKTFFKVGEQDYRAICGAENNTPGPTLYLRFNRKTKTFF